MTVWEEWEKEERQKKLAEEKRKRDDRSNLTVGLAGVALCLIIGVLCPPIGGIVLITWILIHGFNEH